MPPTLAQRLLAGDRRALARGISLVEDDRPEGWALVREVYPHTGRAAVFGFTGPPGVGKSTLIGALTRARRAAGRTVGVLSIDPSSPFTHGALLGDRIRLGEHFLDPGVFIRSMASRGALGGLSEAALQTALLLDAAGRDDVFVETVGVGQAEVDIIDHADTVVLVLMPGSGDSIQALKAGVMEIPDVIVVNKADHPLTDTMVREIRGVLSLANLDRDHPPGHRAEGDGVDGGGAEGRHADERRAEWRRWRVPIVRTEAAAGRGIPELVERLEEHRAHILAEGHLAKRRRRNLRSEVLALASARLRRRLELEVQGDGELERLLDEVVERRLDPASAATALLARAASNSSDLLPSGDPGRPATAERRGARED
jgi:GTPase